MRLHITASARGAALALAALLLASGLAQAQTAAPAATGAAAPTKKVQPPARDAPCLKCHDDLFEEAVVHSGAAMGCKGCHGGIDASGRPHKLLNKVPSGLTSAPPELCMGCHDESDFKKKTIHGALGKGGCLACHEAHSSKHKNLLKEAVPQLCVSCHKVGTYFGKGLHSGVKAGTCLNCHEQHASDQAVLLKKKPAETCLACHDDIRDASATQDGFQHQNHLLGDEVRAQQKADPQRAGKPFYCASCHQPHKSEFPSLLRYEPKPGRGVCYKCHEFL